MGKQHVHEDGYLHQLVVECWVGNGNKSMGMPTCGPIARSEAKGRTNDVQEYADFTVAQKLAN